MANFESGCGLVRAAAEGVLRPVAVVTEELEAVFGETTPLEPTIKASPDFSSVPCPIPANVVDGKEGRLGFRTACAFVPVSRKNLCPEPVPSLQTMFPPLAPVGFVAEVSNSLFASSAVGGIATPIKGKETEREDGSTAGAPAMPSSYVKLPVFPYSPHPSTAPPLSCDVSLAPPTAADQPSFLNQPKMACRKTSLAFRAASIRFHRLYGSRYVSLIHSGACK